MAQQYRVVVDWDNNGDFSGTYNLQPVLNGDGVGISAGRDTPRTFNPTKPGEATWVADDSDKRFSDFTASPIAADLLPYRAVKVQTSADGASWSDLFTGVLDGWDVKLDNYPLITASFDALDKLAFMAQQNISTPLYHNLSTDTAVGFVLDTVGWPAGLRRLDAGLTQLGYWWADGKTALAALQELADHEQGFFYISADGYFVFEYRYNRVDRSGTIAATWDEAYSVSAVSWRYNVKDVVNRVTVTVEPRTQDASPSVVWQLGTTLNLGANQTIRLYCTGQDPYTAAITPVSGTDYTLTSGGVGSMTLTQGSGQTAYLDITAGSAGATLTGLQLRAYAVKITSPVVWVAEDTTSQANYGLKTLDLKLSYLADPNVGRDAAQAILARYSLPVPAVDLTIRASTYDTSQKLTDVTTVKLSDQVSLNLPVIGVVWPGYVEAVKHTLRNEMHEAVYTVLQAMAEGIATLDDSFYGVLDADQTKLGW